MLDERIRRAVQSLNQIDPVPRPIGSVLRSRLHRRIAAGGTAVVLIAAGVGAALTLSHGGQPRTIRVIGPTQSTVPGSTPLTSLPSATPVTTESLDQVVFLNATDGYGLFLAARGAMGSLEVAPTHDGGLSFAPPIQVASFDSQNSRPANLLAFNGLGDGFVYGPELFASHDHGVSWSLVPGFSNVVSVIPLGRSVWVLQGTCPPASITCTATIETSSDGGRTWATVALPASGRIGGGYAMIRTSPSAALLVGSANPQTFGPAPTSSLTLLTMDGGRTWRQSSAPCVGMSTFLSQAGDGTVWLACASEPGAGNQAKTLARSFDGGVHWTPEHCPTESKPPTFPTCYFSGEMNAGYLGSLVATSSTTAFLAGGRNNVLVTRDGGKTWNQTTPQIGDMDNGSGPLFFANRTDGWVISGASNTGVANALWRTTNGGSTWSEVWSAGSIG